MMTMPKPASDWKAILRNPLPLSAALDLLEDAQGIPTSSKAAIRSTAIDAVRYALRDGDSILSKQAALQADIREVIPTLHAAARAVARQKGHQAPGDHEARAHRFVEVLTGGRRFSTPRIDFPCPPAWRPLANALRQKGGVPNGVGEMGWLARCCRVAGFQDAPARLPSYDALLAAAEELGGERGRRRVKSGAMSAYRKAREILLGMASPAERDDITRRFAALPRAHSRRTNHLAVEPETAHLLRARGFTPEEMTPEAMFRALAPELASDYDYWVAVPGAQQSQVYQERCLASLLQCAGWAVRAGWGEALHEMRGLDDLFATGVAVGNAMVLNPRIRERQRQRGTDGQMTVALLEHLAEQEAAASLERSTITTPEIAGCAPDGRPWFTHAIHQLCSRIWKLTSDIYRDLATQGDEMAARWALVESRWSHLQKALSVRAIPAAARHTAKDKLRLIRTVTLPQLVCVAMPLRRQELHRMRGVWQEALARARDAGHLHPDRHPAVVAAAETYFENALSHCILTLALDDGMRRKQYTRGRLGFAANFRPVLSFGPDGTPSGIARLTTWWTGDRRDLASLKIPERKGMVARREDRDVRWGCVDRTILWDLISHWRPRQLVAAGAYRSLTEYDLIQDLRGGEYALFPSAKRETLRPERSRTDIGDLAGRELHRVARAYLRPELPAWDALDERWRSLWAIHVTRLLIGSYWGGARGDWETARYLTQDKEETLRSAYAEIADDLRDRLGPDTVHWEHLRAYDAWMDRLYYSREECDPMLDTELPLPEHLRDVAAAYRAREHEVGAGRGACIRRARPGQMPPTRRR